MTEGDSWNDKENLESQTLLTPTKKLYFKEVGSILKSLKHKRRKESDYLQAYFKPRSNIKLTKKRGMFRSLAFKIYML